MEPEKEEKGKENGGSETRKMPILSEEKNMAYTIQDRLPIPLMLLLGFQHFLMAFVSTPGLPLLLIGPMCMEGDGVAASQLICVNFVVAGIGTILQTLLGVRLPIVQGTSFAYLSPMLSVLALKQWQCPPLVTHPDNNLTHFNISGLGFDTNETLVALESSMHKEIWRSRVNEINGGLMVASLLQVVLGFSGLLSVLLRFLGPLSICPTITVIGLGLADAAADRSSHQWWIALLVVVLIVVFSQLMEKVYLPLPCASSLDSPDQEPRASRCADAYRLYLFALFPLMLSILITWFICYILTITDVFPPEVGKWGQSARTDATSGVLSDAPWFFVPYPGQFGVPTVSAGAVVGMFAGVLASIFESVGDYYACAQISDAPVPPSHAINRGIGVEGVASIIAAALGACSASTSYSQNIAAIGITRVANRAVVVVCGVLMVLFGLVGKVGALFVSISEPIIGGMFIIMFGMIAAVGLSQLQHVNLQKPRNLLVLGLSIFMGLSIPRWIGRNPGSIDTGSELADQILEVLLTTGMFVAGLIGFVLDNLLPGSKADRGMTSLRQEESKDVYSEEDKHQIYSVPFLNRLRCSSYLPFCAAYRHPDDSEPVGLRAEAVSESRL